MMKEDFAIRGLADEALGPEGAALGVSGEVADGSAALSSGLELGVPGGGGTEGTTLIGGEIAVEVGVASLEGGVDEGTEAVGEGAEWDEKLPGLLGVDELVGGRVVSNGGDDAMNVRMVLHGTAPGVEDAGDAEAQTGRFELGGGEVVEGLGTRFEKEVVEFGGAMEAKGTKFRRDGEGDEKGRDVEEFSFLLGGPLLLIKAAALRAGAVVAAVVGVVFLAAGAAGATVKMAPEGGRPARKDVPDGSVVGSGEVGAMVPGVSGPMRPQDLGEGDGHRGDEGALVSGEGTKGFAGPGLADLGEVKVNEGRFEAAVTEVGGDLADVHAGFKKVGGVAVSQGVDDEFEVFPIETALNFGELPDLPGGGVAHRLATVMEGLLQGDAGRLPATSGSGKDPVGVAMPGPEAAQSVEESGGDGDESFVAALGVPGGDTDEAALSVDVGRFEVKGFVEPQTALVDGGEEGAVSSVAQGAEDEGDFLAGEDVREGFFAFDFDLAPDLPLMPEVVAIEGAKGADGLVDGGGFEVALGLEVEEEVEDFGAAQNGQVLPGIVIVELLDPAEVGLGGSFAEAFELDKAGEFLIPLLRSEDVMVVVFLP
jgi:hypothetical protein